MNPVLLHYASGSATADWIRACREVEAAEDFAALNTGPLEPESAETVEPQELPA